MDELNRKKCSEQENSTIDKKEDITTQFKIAFLEEIVGINDFDFDAVPIKLIEYYVGLKLRDLI